jgi:iron complex transport system permease protein
MGGTISFVGLIAPHIVRRLYTPQHRFLVPVSMLFGGIFLVLADMLSRALIPPAEIPVGIITALIGSPFFISMLISSEGENHD